MNARSTLSAAALFAWWPVVCGLLCSARASEHANGAATLTESELCAHAAVLASPLLEGRDSPSLGLEAAAQYIEQQFQRAGLETVHGPQTGASDAKSYRQRFDRSLPEADLPACVLSLELEGASPQSYRGGVDFVPLAECTGDARGELVFVGFGISSKSEHYNDLDGLSLRGKIALIVEGEPRHARRFDGPELSSAASLWRKLDDLRQAGVAGVLVTRRPPAASKSAGGKDEASAHAALEGKLGFRHSWARFNGVAPDAVATKTPPPALEVSAACAQSLLGEDVLALAQKIDNSVRPARVKSSGRKIVMSARVREVAIGVDNLVGILRGSDPALSHEMVVLGAHYDHLGVDERGRIACGADDNASGTSALLELAQALVAAAPRRSVVFCAFAGEEVGLLGSKAFCTHPPVSKENIVAMINMDMIGRGDPAEVAVLGIVQNPTLEKLLARARKLSATGVQNLVMRQGEELFARSDHYSFHKLGIPTLFFFEGLPIDKNKDYHTWRDTLDLLDCNKMLRTLRLVYNTTWLLANDDERPPRPRD